MPRNRFGRMVGLSTLVGMVMACVGGGAAGQVGNLRALVQPVTLDSRMVGNDEGRARSVFSQDVQSRGAPWMRVLFDVAELEGDSYILVTSLADGDFQILHADALEQWQNTTAFFNGDRVTVQLVAAPGTKRNRVAVSRILAGELAVQAPPEERRVCVGVDTRVPSTDARVCRMLSIALPVPPCSGGGDNGGLPCGTVSPGSCTGNMTDRAVIGDINNRVLLSAGHCFDLPGSTVCQFEPIPNSDGPTCTMRHPPVAKQFVINRSRVRFDSQGIGQDWAAFVCFPNSNTGRTVYQEGQQVPGFTDGFALANAAPAAGSNLRKYGYGTDGAPTTTDPHCVCIPGAADAARNVTQQTATGTVSAVVGSAICHNVHDCPGDSGESLVNDAGVMVGIGTTGSCDPSNVFSPPCLPDNGNPRNGGTSIVSPQLQAGISAVAGGSPTNDKCDQAITVVNGSTTFSTIGATTDGPPDALCPAAANRQITGDIWFRYTATAANTRFTTRGSSFDTRLALYPVGCPVAANSALACDEDGGGACSGDIFDYTSMITFATVSGTTYLVRVGGYNGASGVGVLTIGPPPANDDCANATVLPAGASGNASFDTRLACTDGDLAAGGGCAGDFGNDVWWQYTGGIGGHVRVQTCGNTNFDTEMAVYGPFAGAPPCGALGVPLACNDDTAGCGDGRQSRLTFASVAGQNYLIRVGGKDGARGTGVLVIAPENDACADALVVAGGLPTGVSVRTVAADTDGPAGCLMGQDVWLRYNHPAGGGIRQLEVNTCEGGPADFDTVLSAYLGAGCPPGALQACNDDECGTASRIVFQVNPGTSYLIRVGGKGTAVGNTDVTFRLRPQAPANDDCVNAQVVGVGLFGYSTYGAQTDGNIPEGCTDNATLSIDNDIWFRYNHPAAGAGGVVQQLEVNTCEVPATFDTALAAYAGAGCSPNGALITCNDNTCGTGSRIVFTVNPGQSYLIRLGSGQAAVGMGSMRVRLLPAGPAPVNDLCADALPIFDGATAFTTTAAGTDGPVGAPNNCNIGQDVWFRYTAACTGPVAVDTCALAGYDTYLAVYGGACGALGAPLLCVDDSAGCGNGRQSRGTFSATSGSAYLIRVGGAAAATGDGVLTIRPIANDDCANFVTANNGANPYCTVGATTDGDNLCGLPITNDVWFRYTATSSSFTRFDVCGSTFDTNIAVYQSAACPPTNLLECNNDADYGTIFGGCNAGGPAVTTSAIVRQTIVGTVYTIRIGGVFGTTGSGTLRIQPCFNDTFAGGTPGIVSIGNGSTPFNTSCATTDAAFNPTPGGAGGACGGINITNDIWFVYRATGTGATSFGTCGSGFDTAIAVYTTGGAFLTCGNDAGCGVGGNNERVTVNTVAGTQYLVRVGGNGAVAGGAGTLTITPPGFSQPNNDCANALAANLGANPFDTTGATTDGRANAACAANSCDLVSYNDIVQDVWFRFTPDATGTYTVDTCAAANFDTKIAVYAGCPPAAPAAAHAPIACNDDDVDGGCSPRSRLTFAGTAGTTVLIRVGGSPGCASTQGTGILTIKFTPGSNDCAGFRMAQIGQNLFTTAGATTDGPADGACVVNQDIWFHFDAGATRRLKVSLCGSTYDTAVAVYRSAACPPVNRLACNDDNEVCGVLSPQSQVLVNTKAGTTYTIRVGGAAAATGAGVLTLTPYCAADWNADGFLTPVDVALMVNAWFTDVTAGVVGDGDFDANGALAPADISAFVNEWFLELNNGCN